MKIYIKIYSSRRIISLLIDNDKKLAIYNGNSIYKNFDKEINDLLDIFSSWQEQYVKPYILDAEHFSIEIENNNNIKKHLGKGTYPENYNDFKKIVEEIIACF